MPVRLTRAATSRGRLFAASRDGQTSRADLGEFKTRREVHLLEGFIGAKGKALDLRTLAGISAAVCYCLLYGRSFNLTPSEGFGWLNAGLCESLYTQLV